MESLRENETIKTKLYLLILFRLPLIATGNNFISQVIINIILNQDLQSVAQLRSILAICSYYCSNFYHLAFRLEPFVRYVSAATMTAAQAKWSDLKQRDPGASVIKDTDTARPAQETRCPGSPRRMSLSSCELGTATHRSKLANLIAYASTRVPASTNEKPLSA